ncbi:MAG TPA: ABC transporter substrate-binding protein [Beijerinckiaceae bacterium]|nr:ABC transporter substrate-binding protein [Beijerinckiaceae bacterium]
MFRTAFGSTSLALCMALAAPGLHAADLRLGVSSPISSIDPHFQNLVPNLAVSAHIFDTLVAMTADAQIRPALAESLKPIDDTTWEVKLRKGVKFHDGSDFTAEDVIFSLDRPPTVVKSPAPFTIYTRAITEKTVVDSHTLRLKTATPYPLLANDLAQVFIVSKKASQNATTEDFNAGKAAIGTGPYRFTSYTAEDRVQMSANPSYWGGKPSWDNVTYRFIASNSTRVAALLSGDVDAIDQVPTQDLERIKKDQNLTFADKPSLRIIYLYVDSGRDAPPFVTAKNGQPLPKNPLKDLRVRQALSMSINRDAIRERIMDGLATPSSHFVPPPLRNNEPGFDTVKFDPDAAKKLLAEAGYPDGFSITIHGPNNRFVNDDKIVQSVAQFFTRIGIDAKVDTMPMGMYATRGAKGEFALGLIGWGAQGGEVSSTLRAIIACANKDRGFGQFNWSNYCNPKVDELLVKALATMDDAARLKTLNEASKMAANDGAIIPIHFQATTWAAKKGITIEGRADERTYAMGFRPAR